MAIGTAVGGSFTLDTAGREDHPAVPNVVTYPVVGQCPSCLLVSTLVYGSFTLGTAKRGLSMVHGCRRSCPSQSAPLCQMNNHIASEQSLRVFCSRQEIHLLYLSFPDFQQPMNGHFSHLLSHPLLYRMLWPNRRGPVSQSSMLDVPFVVLLHASRDGRRWLTWSSVTSGYASRLSVAKMFVIG